MKINLTKPNIDKRELNAANAVLRSGWLIRGKNCAAFESEFAKYVGAKYAIATNGCTMALYLALKRMGIGKGDEVIQPVADRPAHDFRYSLNTSKLKRLGFELKPHFQAHLQETIQWYQTHRSWWTPLKADMYTLK